MNTVRVLMHGMGRQTSALHVASERGVVEPFDVCFHADTQVEGQEVYDWKDKLKAATKTPIVEVTAGNLEQDIREGLKNGTRFASIPTWCYSEEKGAAAPIGRQCTPDYKIAPVRAALKKYLGYKPGERVTRHRVFAALGFSVEERSRMADSDVPWITNEFPLVEEVWWHSGNCVDYLEKEGLGTPPKSACYFCPFKTNDQWRRTKERFPKEWERACDFDERIRRHPKLKQDQYLHRSLKPLAKADIDQDDSQMDIFHCGGMCGL